MKDDTQNITQLRSWLTLHLAPQFNSACWRFCLANQLSPLEICSQSHQQLAKLRLSAKTINAIIKPNNKQIDQIISWSQQGNHHLLKLTDANYPQLLAEIPDPPPILYIWGNPNLLNLPQLAMVGSRKPTHSGLELAYRFATELNHAGFIVTSGLALGIDSAAHQGAIDAPGKTIAVLGSGINVIYPHKNRDLAAKIGENGAIVSEFPLSSPPRAYQFPQRNRIISGLCLGTLVIEARHKSGSLITARLAGEQGREVFALPASILNQSAAGCLDLIQQGAKLTTSIADIVQELSYDMPGWQHSRKPSADTNRAELDKDHHLLVECIGSEITYFDQLVNRTNFSAQKVSTMLCNLKLNGYIIEEMGGYSRGSNGIQQLAK